VPDGYRLVLSDLRSDRRDGVFPGDPGSVILRHPDASLEDRGDHRRAWLVALFIIAGATAAPPATTARASDDLTTPATSAPLSPPPSSSTPAPPGKAVVVSWVADADTVHVAPVDSYTDTTVEVLGIDAPETSECGGMDASTWASNLLTGKTVRLVKDPTQERTDKYGRTLAYLVLPKGKNYSILAARKGYAKAYTYDTPVKLAPQIQAAQTTAKAARLGLWGVPCHGNTTKPVSGQEPATTRAVSATTRRHPASGRVTRQHHRAKPHGTTGGASAGRYRAGEVCKKVDVGHSTIASNGKKITCKPDGARDRWTD
jgi:micrococcal nuclease